MIRKNIGDDVGGVKNCVSFKDALAYGCGNHLNLPCLSFIHLSTLFTYPNKFLVAAGHWGLDKRGSTVSQIGMEVGLHSPHPQKISRN